MKKFIKMSLVAATAVAGLTSTASAGNLTEMIKDTKVNGYVRYRLESDHENKTDMNEKAKAVATVVSKVNDMVTSKVKIVAGESSTQSIDTKAEVAVTEANFVIKAAGATVIAGLQTSQSPFFANNGDTRSHGVTALVPAGPATIAAAYYTTTAAGGLKSLSSVGAAGAMTNNVLALGALTKFGNINVNAWYATVQDGSDLDNGGSNAAALNAHGDALVDASGMSLEVKAKMGAMNAQLMHTELENNGSTLGALTKAVVSGKAGKVSYAAAYAMTDKASGRVTLDNDSDAKSDLSMHVLNMQAVADADAIYLMGGYKISDKTSASLAYLTGDSAGADFDEINVEAGYKLSKNFGASVIYAMGENAGTDFAESRIEVKYTF